MNQSLRTPACPAKRGRPRSADLERRIIRAAQACYSSGGFDGVAMDQLARKAGMSKTTIYLLFRSKQALFDAALDDMLAGLPRASELGSGVTGHSLEERLLVIARRVAHLCSGAGFEMIRRALASSGLPPSLREGIREKAAPYLDAIDDHLRSEAARGTLGLEDTRSATFHFIALVLGPEALRSRWSDSAFGPIDEAQLRGAVKAFTRGHAASSDPPRNRKLECL